MNRILAAGALTVALSWSFLGMTGAQDVVGESGAVPAASQDDGPQTLTVDVERVRVPFTVVDDDGRHVTDLTEADVRVYEDDIRQQIDTFDALTELPLTLALAMDTSGSVRAKIGFEQEAAIEFFFTIMERRRDRGMLVTFDSVVQVLEDFTDSPEILSEAVRDIRVGGSSALYDAAYLSITLKMAEEPPESRRVLIVISDGDDNASEKTLDDVLEVAQRYDVVVYTLSTNDTANFSADRQQRGNRLLEELAEATGGRAYYPFDLEELVNSLADITEDLRNQYIVTYASSNPARDGSRRDIEVRTSDANLKVTARRYYRAPSD